MIQLGFDSRDFLATESTSFASLDGSSANFALNWLN